MRVFAMTSCLVALFCVGVASLARADGESNSGRSTVIVSGSLTCSSFTGTARLELGIGGGSFGGALLGVSGFGGQLFFENKAGTCLDLVAAAASELPTRLCSAEPRASSNPNQEFLIWVCSGSARRVVGAVGELAKSLNSLPSP